MMKRISWGYVLLFLQMTFVGIFVLVVYSYNISTGQKNFLDRSMYSENVMGIQLSNTYLVNQMGEQVDFSIDSISAVGEYAVYKNIAYDLEIIRGIYETTDLFGYSKYIETGRFFNADDFDNHIKAAVIGSEMMDSTYMEDGIRYYGYQDVLYEVIGVFKKTNSDLDYAVYLNLTVLLEADNDYGLYYVDSLNQTTAEQVTKDITEAAAGKYTISMVEYESPVTYFGLGRENSALLICAILSAVFNLIITLIYFAAQKKFTTAVQKLCGMTQKNLLLEYGMKISSVVILSFILIIVIVKLFSEKLGIFFESNHLGWQHFVMTGVTLAVMGALTTVGIVRFVQQVNISDSLKGR